MLKFQAVNEYSLFKRDLHQTIMKEQENRIFSNPQPPLKHILSLKYNSIRRKLALKTIITDSDSRIPSPVRNRLTPC